MTCQHTTPINGCPACWERVMKELAGCAATLSRLQEAVRALFDSAKNGGWDKAVTDLSEAYNAVHRWARETNRPNRQEAS